MYRVIVDVAPKTIKGTKNCHKYVFDSYKTKRAAVSTMKQINQNGKMGTATIEKSRV